MILLFFLPCVIFAGAFQWAYMRLQRPVFLHPIFLQSNIMQLQLQGWDNGLL